MRAGRRDLLEIFQAAVDAVHGARVVAARLHSAGLAGAIYVIAAGKAACAMARGAHDALGARIADAFIVTKRGNAELLPWPVHTAGHPIPDDASLEAGAQLQAFIERLPADAVLLVLLSGGASALLERLPAGVTLAEWRALNEWLLGSGLDIAAINAFRQHVSCLKGGRLAQQLAPRAVWCLAISDVPGDDPAVIASGPVTPVRKSVLDLPGVPRFVQTLLRHAPPPPSADDPCFARVHYDIVARNDDAKRAAATMAGKLGYHALIDPSAVTGDALQAGTRLADAVLNAERGIVHVWGGETAITLPSQPGRGGRCQSLALAAALRLRQHADVYLLAAGTDGDDGPTEDAGALVDGETVARGAEAGQDAAVALARADAGTFLEISGDLFQTGPTGTNVMDLMLGLRA